MKTLKLFLAFLFLSTIGFTQTNWYAQNSGVDNFLFDVYFVDQDHGWIGGNTGLILYTDDGGLNWVELDPPPSNNYGNIFFSDLENGWASGPGPQLIHTQDGGETWNFQDPGEETGLHDIFFLDENKGWIVGGDNGVFPSLIPHRLIIKTENGGSSWTTQIFEADQSPLSSVHFTGQTNGWAVGENGIALHTADGGDTWTTELSEDSYRFDEVFFITEQKGWILAEYLGLPHAAVIFRTTDGGQNWTSQEVSDDLALTDVHFSDQNNGWVVGGEVDQALLLHTTDGGETWNPVSSPVAQFFSAVHFVDENSGWAVGYGGEVISTLEFIAADHTLDLGEGWSGISSYVKPSDPLVENIFFPILIEMNIIQNFEGMYWPAAGINTLGNWDHHAGYQIKMESTQQITLSGILQNNLTISLQEGWNYLPVLNSCETNADELFAQIAGELEIAKAIAGWEVYWPAYGVNTIGSLSPGKAYFVLVNASTELEFPHCITPPDIPPHSANGNQLSAPSYKKKITGMNPTPVSHTIAIPAKAQENLQPGDIIRLLNQNGEVMDAAIVEQRNTVLTAFADDPTTSETDGMLAGERFRFELYQKQNGRILPLQTVFSNRLPNGSRFADHGLSAVKSFIKSGVGEKTSLVIQASVYPNPSDGMFLIRAGDTDQSFNYKISNMHGAIIAGGRETGAELTLDLSDYPAGIYHLNLAQGQKQAVKKLILR